ncbi:hypothetical protein CRX72_23200 [Pantoea sp. BRM17]|nr:hypothetical protein CRX72_23200 [Pantoea sp. BRM17]
MDESGEWSLTILAGQLATLEPGSYQMSVSAQDKAGNLASAVRTVTVEDAGSTDFSATTIDSLNGNHDSQTLSDLFTVAVHQLPSLTLQQPFGDGVIAPGDMDHWHLIQGSSDHLTQGSLVTVTLGDRHMNIGGDTFLNAQEAQQPLSFYLEGVNQLTLNGKAYTPVNGMVTLSVADLQALPDGPVSAMAERWDSFCVGDNVYHAAIDAQGHWQAIVPAGEVSSFISLGEVRVYALDAAGNSTDTTLELNVVTTLPDIYCEEVSARDPNGKTSTVQHELTLVTHPESLPHISFDSVTADNVINFAESQQDLMLSGTLSALTPGQKLEDNAISVAEGIYGVEVSGLVTHMPLNSHVTLTLGNRSTTALVDEHGAWQATFTPEDLHALPDGVYQMHSTVNHWGYWHATMPPSILQGLADGNYSLTLTISDKAGNSTATEVGFGVYVDKTLRPEISVAPVSGAERVSPIMTSRQHRDTTPPAALHPYEPLAQDGVIAAWESNRAIHLRGRAEQEPGATVTLSFNGESWLPLTLLPAGNPFSSGETGHAVMACMAHRSA